MEKKWLWQMQYCKKNGIPPAQPMAWNQAEKAYLKLPIEEQMYPMDTQNQKLQQKNKIMFIYQKMKEEGNAFDPLKYLDILKLRDPEGNTVAHKIIRSLRIGFQFDPDKHLEILKWKNDFNDTVAHAMAYNGYKFDPDKHKDILTWKNDYGYTIAHIMAQKGYVFDPDKHFDILALRGRYNETVAHSMSQVGNGFDPKKYPEIVEWEDVYGFKVAEERGQGVFLDSDSKPESKEERLNECAPGM